MSTKYNFKNKDNNDNVIKTEYNIRNNKSEQKDNPVLHKGSVIIGIISFLAILFSVAIFSLANKPQTVASDMPTYDEQVDYLKQIADDELYDVDLHDWEIIQESSSVHEGEDIEFTSMNNYTRVWNIHNSMSEIDFKNFANSVAGIDIEKAARTDENYYIDCNIDEEKCSAGYSIYDDNKEYRIDISQPSESSASSNYNGNKNVISLSVTDRLYDNLSEEEKNHIIDNINNKDET